MIFITLYVKLFWHRPLGGIQWPRTKEIGFAEFSDVIDPERD